ncbi:hypothetical protein [Absidia glauca]|uniref:Uncharacterized protein n=1 Tax=Absidia glauca TaxID=4829 RepID=A0A163JKY1_ABSGL|nr:hypothetical protein [Absidia glauca]
MGKLSTHQCAVCGGPTLTKPQRKIHRDICLSPYSRTQSTSSAMLINDDDVDFDFEGCAADVDIDDNDNQSMDGDNSLFTGTEAVTEPRIYAASDFGVETDHADHISSMLFEVAKVYNVPREGFNQILKIINNNIIPVAVDNPGMKVKSAYKSLKTMKAMHPVHFEKYDSCVNGCMMFPGHGGLVNTCRFCKKPRYQKSPPAGVATPISHVSVGSISDIVASKLYYPSTRAQLLYRSQRATNTDRLADIFDGSVYRKMVLGGYFDSPYKKHNLCQLVLIPGNNKPKDLDSFLAPILSELELLSRVGIKVATVDEGIISSKVHILTFVGDIPAVADLIKHSGHTSYHGCRMCVVKGVYGGGANFGSGGMYFPAIASLSPLRKHSEHKNGGLLGIRASAVASLPTFTGVHFFGLDEMHLLGHGLAKMLFALVLPVKTNKMASRQDKAFPDVPANYPFCSANTNLLQNVGKDMLSSKPDIPLSFFNGNWDNIEQHQSARAVDWMDFLLFVVPTLIIPSLYHPKAREKLKNLIISIHLSLHWQLHASDVQFIESSIAAFQHFLYLQIQSNHLSRRCCTIDIHYLGHFHFIINCLGPLPVYSCRSLERTIGHYKHRKRSTSSPGSSYQMILESESSLNHRKALTELGKGALQDLRLLGKPDRSSAPPDPVSYDLLHTATLTYLHANLDNDDITITNNDFAYHRCVIYKKHVHKSMYAVSQRTANNTSFGQATFLFKAHMDKYFFGLARFFFEVCVGNVSYQLVALQDSFPD